MSVDIAPGLSPPVELLPLVLLILIVQARANVQTFRRDDQKTTTRMERRGLQRGDARVWPLCACCASVRRCLLSRLSLYSLPAVEVSCYETLSVPVAALTCYLPGRLRRNCDSIQVCAFISHDFVREKGQGFAPLFTITASVHVARRAGAGGGGGRSTP